MKPHLKTANRTRKTDASWDTPKLPVADSKISNYQTQSLTTSFVVVFKKFTYTDVFEKKRNHKPEICS